MWNEWLVLLVSLIYIGLLFIIAYWGEKRRPPRPGSIVEPTIYALSLAIYCTSWTFYGSVGRAATAGLDFLLIYVGPILVMTVGHRTLLRMVGLAKRYNITSIADFIGSRYGKSRAVAALATLIAVVGVLPYIALQLEAVTDSFDVLIGRVADPEPDESLPPWRDTALIVAVMMATFTVLFGIRAVEATERHRGMMLAIAFESLVKLAAFLAAGLFVWIEVLGGGLELMRRLEEAPEIAERLGGSGVTMNWVVLGLLSTLAFLCLPRQFHVGVVEHDDARSLAVARWLFPLYLVVINLFVIPIAAGGLLGLPAEADPDLFVLSVPWSYGADNLSVFVFIGGLSAATSMVIVSGLALSIMVSNELVIPLLLSLRRFAGRDLQRVVLTVRRTAVFCILLAAYAYNRAIADVLPLVSIGLISFAAVAQFGPPLLIGLYWRGAHRQGAVAGLVGGFAVWVYVLLLPSFAAGQGDAARAGVLEGLFPWLRGVLDPLSQGVVASLLVNIGLLVAGSWFAVPRRRDQEQTEAFVDFAPGSDRYPAPRPRAHRSVTELKQLAARFVGREHADRAFAGLVDKDSAAAFTERLLSGVIGAASARVVMASTRPGGHLTMRTARAMLGEASEAIVHNFELLRTTLDHVSQGIAVFDEERKLATWNDRFFTLLRLPRSLAEVGLPVESLTATMPPDMAAALVWQGRGALVEEASFADGTALELRLDPMPGGGFSITVTDVSERRQAEQALRLANESLERRVGERTADLTQVIAELDRARAAAEEANLGKTRFIAAASHDLLQPLHAARLFAAALSERLREEPLLGKLDQGLGAVEALLDALLDLSRLDAGALKAEPRALALMPLISHLASTLAPLATKRGVDLVVVPTSAAVTSDPQLLRRVLQNLLSNAIRYSDPQRPRSRVLIGVRRCGPGQVQLQVLDSGPGITEEQKTLIFGEFVRLGGPKDDGGWRGLGLGLAIVDRICRLLGHPVVLHSRPGRGSLFGITLPVAALAEVEPAEPPPPQVPAAIGQAFVLAVDDEPQVREAAAAALSSWGCQVVVAADLAEARAVLARAGREPDVLLVDLNLGAGEDGLAVIAALREDIGWKVPAALVTATRDEALRRDARRLGIAMLTKPLRPAALRAFVEQSRRSARSQPRPAA